ncbi:MAG: ABC transporter permease [Thermotoga sp.]|nr:ABC transporter permease [Thermotogota bacterium]RKX53214.1 MAG: ABC transporter permease [Thermotoga sp.]
MKLLKTLLKSKKFIIGLCVFLLLLFGSLIFTTISSHDPAEMIGFLYEPPSKEHLLGTDNFGRDVLIELIYGMKTSIYVGLLSGIIATFIGTTIGTTAGYLGKTIDNILNSITNLFLVIPSFVILILLSVSLRSRSLTLLAMIIGITSWPWTARAVRAQTSSLKTREHVNMAKLNGEGYVEIVLKEILPYMLSYIFMVFVLQVASGILSEAGLSMLGLGPSNTISLGKMLSWALLYEAVRTGAWWAFIPPALTIAIITFSLLYMNTGMDEVFNPRLRS